MKNLYQRSYEINIRPSRKPPSMLHRKLTSLTRSDRRNPRGERKSVKIMG